MPLAPTAPAFAVATDTAPLVEAVVQFFKSGKSPVDARETLEIYAFMQAADESKAANGKEVPLKLEWE